MASFAIRPRAFSLLGRHGVVLVVARAWIRRIDANVDASTYAFLGGPVGIRNLRGRFAAP